MSKTSCTFFIWSSIWWVSQLSIIGKLSLGTTCTLHRLFRRRPISNFRWSSWVASRHTPCASRRWFSWHSKISSNSSTSKSSIVIIQNLICRNVNSCIHINIRKTIQAQSSSCKKLFQKWHLTTFLCEIETVHDVLSRCTFTHFELHLWHSFRNVVI